MNITVDGEHVHPDYPCYTLFNNAICYNQGVCTNGVCVCNEGKTGTYCEKDVEVASSSDSSTVVIVVVSVVVPVAVALLLISIIVIIVVLVRKNQQKEEEWAIDFDELQIGESLGVGGYGEVFKANWKGTEVRHHGNLPLSGECLRPMHISLCIGCCKDDGGTECPSDQADEVQFHQ